MRVLPVAKRKSRRGGRPGHFLRKVCKKAKGTRGTANSASSGTLRSWQRARRNQPKKEKSRFFFKKKHVFFHKTQLWLPRGHRPLRVPLMMSLAMRTGPTLFTFVSYTLFHFLVLSRCSLLRRDPRTSFLALFSEAFSDARVYRSPMYLCSKVFFFLRRKKSAFKRSCRVRGMGPPPGTRFCMYSYHI